MWIARSGGVPLAGHPLERIAMDIDEEMIEDRMTPEEVIAAVVAMIRPRQQHDILNALLSNRRAVNSRMAWYFIDEIQQAMNDYHDMACPDDEISILESRP